MFADVIIYYRFVFFLDLKNNGQNIFFSLKTCLYTSINRKGFHICMSYPELNIMKFVNYTARGVECI